VFYLPTKGIVTYFKARIGQNRLLNTCLISNDDIDDIRKKQGKYYKSDTLSSNSAGSDESKTHPLASQGQSASGNKATSPFEQYIPDLFRLPLVSIGYGENIIIQMNYMEIMDYYDNSYHLSIPLKFGSHILSENMNIQSSNEKSKIPPQNDNDPLLSRQLSSDIPSNMRISDIISLKIIIGILSTDMQLSFHSDTHDLIEVSQSNTQMVYKANYRDESIVDFNMRYGFVSSEIQAQIVTKLAESDSIDQRNNFLMFVTPPTKNLDVVKAFARNVIFLLDRSGSMVGEPFNEAIAAIAQCLRSLTDGDKFNIVAFDHDATYFQRELTPASGESIELAIQWIGQQLPRRGQTEILHPLNEAVTLLNDNNGNKILSCVVLVTDGCVRNEKDIIKQIAPICGNVRILTLAIGSYSNWFFLKLLAHVSRGFDSVVVYKEEIRDKATRLFNCCASFIERY